jgi:hypothetical protein
MSTLTQVLWPGGSCSTTQQRLCATASGFLLLAHSTSTCCFSYLQGLRPQPVCRRGEGKRDT